VTGMGEFLCAKKKKWAVRRRGEGKEGKIVKMGNILKKIRARSFYGRGPP